eukprot:Skav209392  [mRNA]  locus=scaffold962:251:676:- [translate_table: standard]
MASMQNKLCSCLGFALRLAKRSHVDTVVCDYLQAALFTLSKDQHRDLTGAVKRRKICLTDGLEIQFTPSGGACPEEPSCRIAELSSKLATIRLQFQEDLATLKESYKLQKAEVVSLHSESIHLYRQYVAVADAVQCAAEEI